MGGFFHLIGSGPFKLRQKPRPPKLVGGQKSTARFTFCTWKNCQQLYVGSSTRGSSKGSCGHEKPIEFVSLVQCQSSSPTLALCAGTSLGKDSDLLPLYSPRLVNSLAHNCKKLCMCACIHACAHTYTKYIYFFFFLWSQPCKVDNV